MVSQTDDGLYCASSDAMQLAGKEAVRGVCERAVLLNAAFWGRGALLTVGFMEGEAALRRRVAEIARLWVTETGADLGFEFWIEPERDAREANIRIAFQSGKGSWSVLGRFALQTNPNESTMNLGWMSLGLEEMKAKAVVLHEFGHAIGLIHEHLNPTQVINWNVMNVVADLRQSQGWDDATIHANMFAYYDPTTVFATDVDPHSIMMYPIPQRWTSNGYSTGFNSALTDSDKALIRAAYGSKPVFGAK